MAQNVQSIKGMNDLFPLAAEGMDLLLWARIEEAARRVFPAFGYDEIRTPIAEKTELFTRSIGAATDVVEKEMYTFDDKGDSLTLRPEGTAGVVRAFVEHGFPQWDPQARFWYLGPMFRRERPQKGRYRQFWQLGVECFGARAPRVDAEQLAMVMALFAEVGIRGVVLQLASLGDSACRPQYKTLLQTFLRGVSEKLCEDCKRRIESNPLRVLDCKKEGCRAATADAPILLDHLCPPCAEHFSEVKRNLDLLGVKYEINPRIVRGLDYYVRTSFEFIHRVEGPDAALGSQNAVGGGGRYDGLVKELGGGDVPGIGFGLGMERLVLVLQAQEGASKRPPVVYLATMSKSAGDRAMTLARELRARGLRVELDYENKQKLGNQLDKANRRGARAALILGDDEIAKGS
ncbi:MAG TPA: histidine--tRNA ligase, partial [bacterium]|nr:histidine--tRNA ligase [bacterium]